MFNIKNNSKSEKGVILYLALLIMGILVAIGAGLSVIIISQIKITREIGDSVVALMAADTGIEAALYNLYKTRLPNCSASSLPFTCTDNVRNAFFEVTAKGASDPACPNPPNEYYCLKSIGIYRETRRSIEASY